MPSTNSSALRLQFEQMAKRLSESHDFGLDGMRDMSDQLARRQQEPTGVTYEEIGIGDRTAVWTRPLHADSGHALLYFHGGGYVTLSADTDRKLIGHLAKAAGAWALAPDYRLAPEHVFPAQLKDGLDAYRWLLDHGYDHHRIALAGESAGGNLALATAVKLRDDGLPMPAAVIAFSPWLDLDGTTSTFDTNADADAFLNRDVNNLMAGMFLGQTPPDDALANPRFSDPAGLPPLYMTVGSDETLLASIRDYAATARTAGADVTLEVGEGMQHAWIWMAGRAPEADATIGRAGKWLRERYDD